MYAMLSTLGPDGWETLRQHPERILAVRSEVEALGLKVHAQYALMGQYDFLNLIEAPDEQTMAKAAIMLAARGTMRTTTLPAIPVEDLIARLVGVVDALLDPPRPAASLFAQVVLVEEHGQDRSVGSATQLVARAAPSCDAFGDFEAPRPGSFETGPDFDARAGAHEGIVRRWSSGQGGIENREALRQSLAP